MIMYSDFYPVSDSNESRWEPYPLSGAYHDGVAYGISYYDGVGRYELLDRTFTCLNHAFTHIDELEYDPDSSYRVVILRVESREKR